jgi:CelD/BcsL family acetyltransferase involved in cellulose biosynthesis
VVDEFSNEREIDAAIDELIRLHGARAASDRGPAHADQLADVAARRFLRRAVRALAAAGHATPAIMEIEGAACAARLLLHGDRTTFFSLSGFDPQWWDFGIGTTLMTEILRRRIEHGDVRVNLSLSPDRPKLRWSKELRLYQDFAVVRTNRRARSAYRAFRVAQAALARPAALMHL